MCVDRPNSRYNVGGDFGLYEIGVEKHDGCFISDLAQYPKDATRARMASTSWKVRRQSTTVHNTPLHESTHL